MKTTALFGAVAALALGGAAGAADHHNSQTGYQDPGDWTEEKWGDHDTRAFNMMFESRLQRAFSAIDTSNDRSISFQEWGEWQADGGFYAERFDMFDSDSNRSISWNEYRTATMSLYDTRALTGGQSMDGESMNHQRMMRQDGSMGRGHPMNDGHSMDERDMDERGSQDGDSY